MRAESPNSPAKTRRHAAVFTGRLRLFGAALWILLGFSGCLTAEESGRAEATGEHGEPSVSEPARPSFGPTVEVASIRDDTFCTTLHFGTMPKALSAETCGSSPLYNDFVLDPSLAFCDYYLPENTNDEAATSLDSFQTCLAATAHPRVTAETEFGLDVSSYSLCGSEPVQLSRKSLFEVSRAPVTTVTKDACETSLTSLEQIDHWLSIRFREPSDCGFGGIYQLLMADYFVDREGNVHLEAQIQTNVIALGVCTNADTYSGTVLVPAPKAGGCTHVYLTPGEAVRCP